MTRIDGGRLVADALKAEGVSHVFTLCGGHIQAIYDGCLDVDIRVVDVRHEQTAGHAADGWARVTGTPGVALVTAGPGVTDAVTAIANARRAGVPMLVIGGQGPLAYRGMGSLQEMDHVGLVAEVAKWADVCLETRRIPEMIQTAFRHAMTGVPGPAFLEIPLDVLMGDAPEEDLRRYPGYRPEARPAGDPVALQLAAAAVQAAEKPVLLCGSQIRWSNDPSKQLASFLATCPMPVFPNGLARGVLPPDHPLLFGLTRTPTLREADLVIVCGTPFDFRLGYGSTDKIPDARIVQIDRDGSEIGRNRAVDIGIVGDTGLVLDGIAERIGDLPEELECDDWVEEVREGEEAKRATMADEEASDAVPVNPLRLCREIEDALPDDAIVVGDGGDILGTAAKIVTARGVGQWMDPGPLGTLGVGPGFAMAAKLARPDAEVVIIYGDGSFGLHGLEWEAMVRQDIKVTGVIGHDAAWQQIRRGQVAMYGEERAVATGLDQTRYDRVVEAVGGLGIHCEAPEEVGPAIERALADPRPALVNVTMGESDFRRGAISV